MRDRIVALIVGRKGSKGLADKNIMNILGRPAFFYPCLAAANSKFINEIYVSTNHPKIIRGAQKFKFNIIPRPDYLCTNESLLEDTILHAYKIILKESKNKPRYIVLLMCNAVTINSKLIDNGINKLNKDPKADSAVTVSIFNMYSPIRARKINNKGYLDPFVPFAKYINFKKFSSSRDSQGDAFFADMSHSIFRVRCLDNLNKGLLPQKWMGKKILPVRNFFGCDIDERWQVDVSIRWLKDNGFSNLKTPYKK